jgi:hypothetical protein
LKKKKVNNKVCPYCNETFTQKSNRDRHIKRYHPSNDTISSDANVEEEINQVPTLDADMANVMNVSFVNDDGSFIDTSIVMIDEVTPIYEVFQPVFNSSFVEQDDQEGQASSSMFPIDSANNATIELESMGTAYSSTATAATVPPDWTESENTSDTVPPASAESTNVSATPDAFSIEEESNTNSFVDILKDLEERVNQRDIDHELRFKNKVMAKLKQDIKCRRSKHTAARFLFETFGESLSDYSFICWLAKKLEMKPCRLKEVLKNCEKEFASRTPLASATKQSVYNFWLKEENSIVSNDRRNGRDIVRISKATYLSKYGDIEDPNIEEEEVILKKTSNVKRNIKAPRMVYTKKTAY